MRPTPWLLPVFWMALIMWFSSDAASAEHTGHWLLPIFQALAPWATPAQIETMHGLVRKGAHLTEYAILAALWLRALARSLYARHRPRPGPSRGFATPAQPAEPTGDDGPPASSSGPGR